MNMQISIREAVHQDSFWNRDKRQLEDVEKPIKRYGLEGMEANYTVLSTKRESVRKPSKVLGSQLSKLCAVDRFVDSASVGKPVKRLCQMEAN